MLNEKLDTSCSYVEEDLRSSGNRISNFTIAAIVGSPKFTPADDQPPTSDKLERNEADDSSKFDKDPEEESPPENKSLLTYLECTTKESMKEIQCQLESQELWLRFHELGTEMIITKSGRRMFPTIRVTFSGCCPETKYIVLLDIVPFDSKRYRYAYHRSCWLVAGKADHSIRSRVFVHPDSPFTGEQLRKQVVTFEKLKLTNNEADSQGHIILNSMHKYQPRIHLLETAGNEMNNIQEMLQRNEHKIFVFSETQFTAVTAYQNQLITKLKIDSNPFAKGFRDSSRMAEDPFSTLVDVGSLAYQLHHTSNSTTSAHYGYDPCRPIPSRIVPTFPHNAAYWYEKTWPLLTSSNLFWLPLAPQTCFTAPHFWQTVLMGCSNDETKKQEQQDSMEAIACGNLPPLGKKNSLIDKALLSCTIGKQNLISRMRRYHPYVQAID